MAPWTRPLTPAAFARAATLPIALATVLLALALLGPGSALARGGPGGGDDRPEVRVAGVCGRGASSRLKLKARDGAIEAEFEVHGRSGARWRVVFVQERRVAWRGRARTAGASRSFSLERRLSDYPGADQVMARAVGPRGLTCTATATLPG
jgi:hypothetical protein